MSSPPTPPAGTQSLAWAMSKLNCSYMIWRANPGQPVPLYELRTSIAIHYGGGSSPLIVTPRYSTAWECEQYVCTTLGWYWYNPGVWFGKVCYTYPAGMLGALKRLDLTYTKLVP